jgi:hypothetical protein
VSVVRMWEAVVAPGRLAEAEAWVRGQAGTSYTDGAERIVLIRPVGGPDPAPPEGLLTRSHGWDFTELALNP